MLILHVFLSLEQILKCVPNLFSGFEQLNVLKKRRRNTEHPIMHAFNMDVETSEHETCEKQLSLIQKNVIWHFNLGNGMKWWILAEIDSLSLVIYQMTNIIVVNQRIHGEDDVPHPTEDDVGVI
ncbi:unnamed protein product [Lactuca saligna]|uniref:Uncharacterized protein n=1 Tax=Lactuca saligna TaxID=75948 RepID=A0AA35USZ8_LACSI|nr:unnamed protein product [Lactuca saligna]